MEKYIKLQTLGQGTFGEVYLVRSTENSRLYALKKVMLDESRKQRTKEYVLSEAKILSQLKHPNIVAYHDSFFDDKEQYLVIIQDYCDGGTLEDRVHAAAKTGDLFDELQIMQWFVQILMAVQYMHTQKILHRDLKSQNVFMKKKGNMCKLGDFGISKRMSNTLERASTLVGTPYYLAPEMCQDIPYSSKADVWALGCVLYEMCALKPPFDANNYVSLAFKIVKCSPDPVSDLFTVPLRELIDTILTKNPDERPSATQLLKLPYIQSMLNYFVMYKSSLPNLSDKQRRDSDPLASTLTEASQFTRLHDNIAAASPGSAHVTKSRTVKSAVCVDHSSRCAAVDDDIDTGPGYIVKSSRSAGAVITSHSQCPNVVGDEDVNSGNAGGKHVVKSSRSAGIVNSSNSRCPSARDGDDMSFRHGSAAGGYMVKSSQSAGAVNNASTRCQSSKLCSSADSHFLTVINSPVAPKRLSPITVNGKNRSPSADTPSPQQADTKFGEFGNDVIDYEDDFEAEEVEDLSSAAESDIDQQVDEDVASDTDSSTDAAAAADVDLFNDRDDIEPDNEYYDDFEEYSPEQEMEEVLSYAKEIQQLSWNSLEDVTITDDGPVDIRKLLQPHCEAVVGKERFDAIITKNNPTSAKNRQSQYVRSSTDQICHFIEELYGADEQP